MARRAPFSLSSIPAYIEFSMKLLCVYAALCTFSSASLRAASAAAFSCTTVAAPHSARQQG